MTNIANVINIQEKREDVSNSLMNVAAERTSGRPLYIMIDLVLSEIRDRSVNTARSYEGYYREFFRITLNKEMEFVTWADLLSINYGVVLEYREQLKKTNINKTINIKTAALSTLYKELYKEDRRVDMVSVDLNKLPEDEDDSVSYGSLTEDEVGALLDYCLALPERQKPLIKKLFFETAFITAIRQGALLNLTWSNIKKVKDSCGAEIWVIRIKDKGKTDNTPITDEFKAKLDELKTIVHSDGLRNKSTDRVFNVTIKTLAKTLSDFCIEHGISESRNIVIHSLKKASIDKVYHETRDINKTARHGHHTGVEMVYKNYQGKNEALKDRPSLLVFGDRNDVSLLESYSKEQLIEAIGGCGQSIVNEILSKLK